MTLLAAAAAAGATMLPGPEPAQACTNPSCQPLPGTTVTDSFGTSWTRYGSDNFTKDAATGSWGTSDPNKYVYFGDHSMHWVEYPDGWSCEQWSPCYRPADVLSVHNGELDFYLHQCTYPDGAFTSCGANPSPLPGGSRYFTYGRVDAMIRLTAPLAGYHDAWLLWPTSDSNYKCAESDYPEFDLNASSFSAFAHYGCSGSQDAFGTGTIDTTAWHHVVQEWGPGFRRYYVDGRLIGQSTHQVWSSPERWQLQTEGHGGTGSAHQYVDWVAIYKLGG